MSAASTLDPDALPGRGPMRPPGHDTGSLGPSDVSDTGSDSLGPSGYDAAILGDSGDSVGTGVDPSPADADDDGGADIGFDRVVRADEAGLGGGLDQAEEARYGTTDEEFDPVDEAGASRAPTGGPRPRTTADDVADGDVDEVARGDDLGEALQDDRMDVVDDGDEEEDAGAGSDER